MQKSEDTRLPNMYKGYIKYLAEFMLPDRLAFLGNPEWDQTSGFRQFRTQWAKLSLLRGDRKYGSLTF